MIPISEALDIIKSQVQTLLTEKVDLAEVGGRVLAQEIFADTDRRLIVRQGTICRKV